MHKRTCTKKTQKAICNSTTVANECFPVIKVARSVPQGIFSVILPMEGVFDQEDDYLYHNRI